MNLFHVYQIEVLGNYSGVRSTQDHLKFGLPWLIPAIIIGLFQHQRLKFKKIDAVLTEYEFKEIAKKAGLKMNWKLERLTGNSAIAFTGLNWGGSWGERITIIRDRDEILINSIHDPDKLISFALWGQNRKNIKAFKLILENTHNKS